ncbi:Transcriptional regulator, LysR family [Cronobacter malonaticus 507]|nr:Transcriptional regulator, LysR family [Cronobacter malonaticus 507]
MHKTTLEQWALLNKVVEEGSFARAAESTHRSQSSVSYNLALLQERLGVALLETQGRRAVLTPAGELLLAQVRPLLSAFSWVEAHAATHATACAPASIWWWTTFSRARRCSLSCASFSASIRPRRCN